MNLNRNALACLVILLFIIGLPVSNASNLKNQLIIFDQSSKAPVGNVLIKKDLILLGRTDDSGSYEIDPEERTGIITIEAAGYFTVLVDLNKNLPPVIYIRKDPQQKTVSILYDKKISKYLTESVSFLDGHEVENMPGTNRLNTLGGRIAGLSVLQESGMPGSEASSIYLRGINSFHKNSLTYIVDGFQTTDVRMLDPYDIKNVTIVKDAAATVMYGLKGTTGIVLIETNKGEAGPLKVSYNTNTAIQSPLQLPKFLSSHEYATLYNEAALNDNPNANLMYSPEDIAGYKANNSPYEYPNVDWVNLLMKEQSVLTRHNLILSGGSQAVRYYLSSSYFYNTGVFNTDESVNTYNTNTTASVFNLHGNVDVNINKNFSMNVDIKSKKDIRDMPGSFSSSYDAAMLSSIYNTPSNAFQPLTYLGKISGSANYGTNPYAQLNHRGFSVLETNYISSTIQAQYKLDKLLEGLSVYGNMGFNSYAQIYTSRTKSYATHRLNAGMTGWLISGTDTELKNSGGYNAMHRDFGQLIGLNYKKEITDNYFNGLLFVDRQQDKEYMYSSLTDNYQGLKGKFTYRHKNRYMLDLSFAYSGSNLFPTYKRYGFFPAASVGWIVTEDFFQKNDQINFLKLRASVGQTGNTINPYFEYLPAFGGASSAYFGNPAIQLKGISEARILNNTITWETSLKSNIGIDFSFFQNKLSGSLDIFNEDNTNILVKNAVSIMFGGDIYSPVGKMNNKGYEIEIGWNDNVSDFNYSMSFVYSFARNNIIFQDEEIQAYPWMYRTGHPYVTRFGYVFDRYFVEDDNFDELPDQSLLGYVQPGDLKYKDLNGDNIIDENDVCAIGKSMIPEISYGARFGFVWKNIDASIFLQGLANLDTYNSGNVHWAFNGSSGNATYEHLGRWQPGSGQDASYPRVSLNTTNNYANSSYWIQDASFLRLKHLEIGYNISSSLLNQMKISKARLFVSGTNLMTWSKIKAYDPESSIGRYPNTKSVSIGANINF